MVLRSADHRRGDFPHLRDPARCAVDVRGCQGLDGVDDEEVRLELVDGAEHDSQIRLRREVEGVRHRVDPLCPQSDLRGRLLSRHVEDPGPLARGPRSHLQEQSRLSDSGFTGEQHDRPGHQASAQYAVEFGDVGRPGLRQPAVDFRDRGGAGVVRCRLRLSAHGPAGGDRLLDRPPFAALRAPAQPLRGRVTARIAQVLHRRRHGPESSTRHGHGRTIRA